MGYRWKPSKAQRQAYAQKLQDAESKYTYIKSKGPIRKGCLISFYDVNSDHVIKGEVINSSYGADKGQHTFTIINFDKTKYMRKGRNVYPRLIDHKQGIASYKDQYKYSLSDDMSCRKGKAILRLEQMRNKKRSA